MNIYDQEADKLKKEIQKRDNELPEKRTLREMWRSFVKWYDELARNYEAP